MAKKVDEYNFFSFGANWFFLIVIIYVILQVI